MKALLNDFNIYDEAPSGAKKLKVTTLTSLSARQWWWFISAYAQLWVVQLRLRVSGASWTIAQIKANRLDMPEAPAQELPQELPEWVSAMHESVRLAARCHFLPTHCLPRAVVLARMLRRRGLPAQIILGVSMAAGMAVPGSITGPVGRAAESTAELASHAWVEVEQTPVGEPKSISTSFTRVDL